MLSIPTGLVVQDQTTQAKPATRPAGEVPDLAFLAVFDAVEGQVALPKGDVSPKGDAPPKGEFVEIDATDGDLPDAPPDAPIDTEAPIDPAEALDDLVELDDPAKGDAPTEAKAEGPEDPLAFAIPALPFSGNKPVAEAIPAAPAGADGTRRIAPTKNAKAGGQTATSPANPLMDKPHFPPMGAPAMEFPPRPEAKATVADVPNAGKTLDAGIPLQYRSAQQESLIAPKSKENLPPSAPIEKLGNRTVPPVQSTSTPGVRADLTAATSPIFPAKGAPKPQLAEQANTDPQKATPQSTGNQPSAQPPLSANTSKPGALHPVDGQVQLSKPDGALDQREHRPSVSPFAQTPAPQANLAPQSGSLALSATMVPAPVLGPPTTKPDLTEEAMRGASPLDGITADLRPPTDAALRPGAVPSQVPQAPDLPRHIAQQIVEAFQRAGGSGERAVDLMLNPAELGRVRISLSPSDAGLTVQIIADRPETLDLMRRNIDMLAQDFQNIGYDATDFAFAQHQGDRDGQGRGGPMANNLPSADTQEPPLQNTAQVLMDRVDIRL